MLVRNNPKALKLWENASEEEKTAATMLCRFQEKTAKNGIDAIFDFADQWDASFPRASKAAYSRGLEAVKIGAKLADVSPQTVYSVLKTAKFYGRNRSLNSNRQYCERMTGKSRKEQSMPFPRRHGTLFPSI